MPGLRSSRINILDTKPEPAQPRIVRVIEPEEITRSRLHPAAYVALRTRRDLHQRARQRDRRRSRRHLHAGSREFRRHRPMGGRSRVAILAYDFWWHLTHDVMITSEWGTPNMIEDGLDPELLLGASTDTLAFLGSQERKHQAEHRPRGGAADGARAASVARSRQDWGFVGVVVSLKDLSSSIWLWHRNNGEWPRRRSSRFPPSRPIRGSAPHAQRLRAVPPLVTDIDLSVDDRYLYVSCWGTGEMRQYDVCDPFTPKFAGSVQIGGIAKRTPHPAKPARARRRTADGGDQPRRKRVYFTNSLYRAWDDQFYADGVGSWMVKLDVADDGKMAFDEKFFMRAIRSIACTRCACRAGTPRRIRTASPSRIAELYGHAAYRGATVHNLAHPASAIESHDRAGIAQLDEEKFERVFCGGAPRGRRKIVSNVNEAIDVECAPLNAMHHVERFFSIARRNHIPGRLMLRLDLTSLKLPGAARHKVRVRHALVEGPVHKKIALTWEPEDRVIPRFTGRLTAAEKDDAVTTLTIEGRPSAPAGVALAAFDVIIGRKLAAATVQALLAEIREFVESDSRRR